MPAVAAPIQEQAPKYPAIFTLLVWLFSGLVISLLDGGIQARIFVQGVVSIAIFGAVPRKHQ